MAKETAKEKAAREKAAAEKAAAEEAKKQAEPGASGEVGAQGADNQPAEQSKSDQGLQNSPDRADNGAPAEIPYVKTSAGGETEKNYLPTGGAMVLVYSKWPHDLRYETRHGICVIKGLSSSKIIGATHSQTSIPIEQWNDIARVYGKTKLFQNHFVFAAKDGEWGNAHAADLAGEKTGVERLEQGKLSIGVDRYQE